MEKEDIEFNQFLVLLAGVAIAFAWPLFEKKIKELLQP